MDLQAILTFRSEDKSVNKTFQGCFLTSVSLAACAALTSVFSATALAQSPEAILQKADEVRNPSASFKMEVEVKNPGGDDTSVFEVSLKGKEKTMIKTLEPSRDKGRNMHMLKEDMWAYIPNLKRAVRISLNQKLTGQAANGDISRMRWAGDYDAKIESQDAGKWKLFLTATKKGLTYDKIRAVIDKKSFHPLKAEYLSPAGKVLKFATFRAYKTIAGAVRPTEIEIVDATKPSDKSIVHILKMENEDFPDSLFNQNNLK